MTKTTPLRIGQQWREVDPRFAVLPLRTVVAIGEPYQRQLTPGRFECEECRDITLQADGGRKSVARDSRFNGKRGGYELVNDAASQVPAAVGHSTLDEALVTMRADVDRFEANWRANAALTPDFYPASLPTGEWHEQLLAFLETAESEP